MKMLKLDESRKQNIVNKLTVMFKEALEKLDASTSSITLPIKVTVERKPVVFFSPTAFVKVSMLIKTNKKEIGWHGTVERFGDDYYIKDIYVYPQKVTSAHIDTDDAEYENWLFDSLSDEVFKELRFHGHSHVDMSVSPSGTDMEHREKLTNQLTDDDLYIFMIGNKKGEYSFEIYDTKKNIIFDTEDVEMDILVDDGTIEGFLEDSEKMVKEDKTVSYLLKSTKKESEDKNKKNKYGTTDTKNPTTTDKKYDEIDDKYTGKKHSYPYDDYDDYDDYYRGYNYDDNYNHGYSNGYGGSYGGWD